MLISLVKNGVGGPRVLALAPDTPGMVNLCATSDGGELAFMREEISGIHIDALIGTVTSTGKFSLADALRDGNYSILHFISHGDEEHAMLTREMISWQELARMLTQHHVNLVMAMTCNSRLFAKGLIAAGTPKVICTRGEISNKDARQFAREFYGAIVRDMPVPDAVQFAKSRMSEDGAALIMLLPDDEEPVDTDPVIVHLKRLEAEQVAWKAEVRHWFVDIDSKLNTCSTHNDETLRALTAAVVHLAEVFSK